jgi:hypothetical protein
LACLPLGLEHCLSSGPPSGIALRGSLCAGNRVRHEDVMPQPILLSVRRYTSLAAGSHAAAGDGNRPSANVVKLATKDPSPDAAASAVIRL